MREIKFKYIFHHKKDGDYQSEIFTLDQIEDNDIKDTLRVWRLDGYELVDRCNFVWLYDDNGKEIYEHDIVEIENKNETTISYVSQVKFGCDGAYIAANPIHKKMGINYDRHISQFCDYGDGGKYNVSCKIVGNIYSNPELLTKE